MSRFVKGQSGNPSGRPRKPRSEMSAFDVVFDKRLTVEQNGSARELSVEEGLQLRTYQDALKGSRLAMRKILKMIEQRETAIADRRGKRSPQKIRVLKNHDSDNADQAMCILGITAERPDSTRAIEPHNFAQLERWAVDAALRRRLPKPLSPNDVADIRRCTINGSALSIPSAKLA